MKSHKKTEKTSNGSMLLGGQKSQIASYHKMHALGEEANISHYKRQPASNQSREFSVN